MMPSQSVEAAPAGSDGGHEAVIGDDDAISFRSHLESAIMGGSCEAGGAEASSGITAAAPNELGDGGLVDEGMLYSQSHSHHQEHPCDFQAECSSVDAYSSYLSAAAVASTHHQHHDLDRQQAQQSHHSQDLGSHAHQQPSFDHLLPHSRSSPHGLAQQTAQSHVGPALHHNMPDLVPLSAGLHSQNYSSSASPSLQNSLTELKPTNAGNQGKREEGSPLKHQHPSDSPQMNRFEEDFFTRFALNYIAEDVERNKKLYCVPL